MRRKKNTRPSIDSTAVVGDGVSYGGKRWFFLAVLLFVVFGLLIGQYAWTKHPDNKKPQNLTYQPSQKLLDSQKYKESMAEIKAAIDAVDPKHVSDLVETAEKNFGVQNQPNVDLLYARFEAGNLYQPVPDTEAQRKAYEKLYELTQSQEDLRSYFMINRSKVADLKTKIDTVVGSPGGVGE